MRRYLLTLALMLLPSLIAAQQDTVLSSQGLPRDVAREATSLFNSSATHRTTGPLDIAEGRVVSADVAVLNGPMTVAGRVTGRVLAINSDVILKPSARIDGDLLVIGGDVEGRNAAYIGGEIRIYRQPLHYSLQGDRIVAERDTAADEDTWWQRWELHRTRNWSKLQIASAGAYNRVEGLPVNLGPQVQRITPWGRLRLDAYAVLRTGSSFSSHENDVGHSIRSEVQLGKRNGLAVGGRLYNVSEGVESWQLSDLEVGLASFLFRRDYRDYYDRHGANGYVTGFLRRGLSVTGTYGMERWGSRTTHNPFTLFNDNDRWRANPLVDEGVMHLGNLTLAYDSRNDQDSPSSGWYMVSDWERGTGTLTPAVAPNPAGPQTPPQPAHSDYARAFFDVRRYNRISPDAELNFRLVLGGWLGGSALPLERRLSIDGPGAMPGFGFREGVPGVDAGTCATVPGLGGVAVEAANCERIALAQAEYRGDLHFGIGDDDSDGHFNRSGGMTFRSDGMWVVFMDAGRGWLVNAPSGQMTYASDRLPPLSTFRTDLGAGLDFGLFGVYAAKAVSTAGEPVHFFVRLHHRF